MMIIAFINSIIEIMYDDISLFIQIVQQGGLGAAATHLNLPPATVTRRLQKLEERIGAKLILRSARKFSLTQEGDIYFQAYEDLIHQMDSTTHSLSSSLHQMKGKLKVSAPTNISLGYLNPMWSTFIQKYPDIQLEVSLSNKIEDMANEKIDLALRIGPQLDSLLTQKRIGSVSTVLTASPAYLEKYGIPQDLVDLKQHRLICVDTLPVWHLRHQDSNVSQDIHPVASTFVNDIRLATLLCKDHAGIALLPMSELYHDIRDEKLVRILPPWCGPEREIFTVWPTGRLLNAKAKCLREFMQDYISKHPVLQGNI